MKSRKNSTDEPIYREEMETQMNTMNLQAQWEKERVVQIEKVILTYIHYHV